MSAAANPVLACRSCGEANSVDVPDGLCKRCAVTLRRAAPKSPTIDSTFPPPALEEITHQAFSDNGDFGDYKIISELARGGMGIVFEALQISLNRRVALKMILMPMASAEVVRRFRAEAENAATLEHPNIVPVYEFGEHKGLQFFSMKLIEGRSLSAEIRRMVHDPRRGVRMLAVVARAVHHAHQRGILHRDLKPANILIGADGVPHVTDFGLAKRVESKDALTQSGSIMGTPQYMSPEQATGTQRNLTVASDVYSLGAILYELLTLRAPFEAPTVLETLSKVKNEEPVAPRKWRPAADIDLETICLKCLEKDPARRYRSAEELAAELDRWLRGEPIHARPLSLAQRAIKWVRRHPAMAAVIALSVALVLSLAGSFWHDREIRRVAEAQKIEEQKRAAENAELQKIAEKKRSADLAFAAGRTALAAARAADAAGNSNDSESALFTAEDRFRAALFALPAHEAATAGMRDAALLHFELSIRGQVWRQAREKLLLAQTAGLSDDEFKRLETQLAKLESERASRIRTRVKALMDDAIAVPRTVLHEMAVYELISLKDPLTVKLLTDYIGHEEPDCRKLAIAALTWIGDAKLVPQIVPYIFDKTPKGAANPLGVQEAAICAVCVLAADSDAATFNAVRERLDVETDPNRELGSLFWRVQVFYRHFAQRVARPAIEPQTSNQWLARARRNIDEQNFKEALTCFDKALEIDPKSIRLLNDRGMLRFQRLGDVKGGLADFDAALAIAPRSPGLLNNRALARKVAGDLAGALADLDRAAAMQPDHVHSYANRGVIKDALKDYPGALKDFDTALAMAPDLAWIWAKRGVTRGAIRNFQGAQADFTRSLELDPRQAEVWYDLAEIRSELGDLDGAIAACDKSLEIDPRADAAYGFRGLSYLNKGSYKEAIQDLDKAIRINTKNAYHFYHRGIARGNVKDLAGAIEDYTKAIELNPKFAKAWVNRGTDKAALGDKAGELDDYDHAIAADPTVMEAYINHAAVRFQENNGEAGLADLKRAIEVNPRYASTYRMRASWYQAHGQKQEAINDLNKALELIPASNERLRKSVQDELAALQK